MLYDCLQNTKKISVSSICKSYISFALENFLLSFQPYSTALINETLQLSYKCFKLYEKSTLFQNLISSEINCLTSHQNKHKCLLWLKMPTVNSNIPTFSLRLRTFITSLHLLFYGLKMFKR